MIIPVGTVTPVDLNGAIVNRATLNNPSEIKRLGIRIGSEVKIRRSNDVIPQIMETLSTGTQNIETPSACPSCGAKTNFDGIRLFCTGAPKDCPAQFSGIILNYLQTLDVKGFGESLVNKLIEAGKVKKFADLYTLTVEDIASMDRVGEKVALKVLKELADKSYQIPVSTFIGALGMKGFSSKTSELLLENFGSFDKILQIPREKLVKVKGIAGTVADNIINGFAERKEDIKEILENKFVTFAEIKLLGDTFANQIFVFTGFRDSDLEKYIAAYGGRVTSATSAKTTCVVAKDPEENSTKIKKAKELGIKVLSLADFKAIHNL